MNKFISIIDDDDTTKIRKCVDAIYDILNQKNTIIENLVPKLHFILFVYLRNKIMHPISIELDNNRGTGWIPHEYVLSAVLDRLTKHQDIGNYTENDNLAKSLYINSNPTNAVSFEEWISSNNDSFLNTSKIFQFSVTDIEKIKFIYHDYK